MKKEIIINSSVDEDRIAILEDNRLSEFFIEGMDNERMLGDIYLGKVARVIPGIKAAFIDIGHRQDAFLHFSDVGARIDEYSAIIGDDSDIDDDIEDLDSDYDDRPKAIIDDAESLSSIGYRKPEKKEVTYRDPAKHLQKGQDIIVQVIKEPIGNKGVRVTSEVSLPGRFLVLMPFDNKIGVSKRINNLKEKRRLKRLVHGFLSKGFGVIIRTVAEGQDEEILKAELKSLIETWHEIEKTIKNEKPPTILYKDMGMTSSVIRDLLTNDVQRVIVDSKKLFREIRTYLISASPNLVDKLEQYKGKDPIFDYYKFQKDIDELYGKKVLMKTGGYIFIEHTEAMVVIDVNSGKYYAKTDQELNSLKTDLEAAREIARQLRLRDIGGLIVVDFIDLEEERNRKKVYDELKKEFKKDKAKSTVLPMTEFGLIQITRQRIRQGLFYAVNEPCPTCGGSGIVKSKSSVLNRIERWLSMYKKKKEGRRLVLSVNPSVANYLKEGIISRILKIQFKNFLFIKLISEPSLPPDEFRFYSQKTNQNLSYYFTNDNRKK
jgi:ribonuclease G